MKKFVQRSMSFFLTALLLITSIPASVFSAAVDSEHYSSAVGDGVAVVIPGDTTLDEGTNTTETTDSEQNTACDHTYWGDCDASCNECEELREPLADHRYSGDCDVDCDVCMEDRTTLADHQYDDTCDEYCNICRSLRHDCHRYDHSCDITCNDCDHVRVISHTYDTLCDPKCNVCGNERVTQHLYTSQCDAVCSVCKSVREVEHTLNEWYDHCTVCDTDIDTCGDDIIWFIQDNTLILSGTGEMYHYDFWYDTVPWGSDIGEIHKVWVGEGITSLGTNAFCEFVNMTDVELPSTLKKMWMNAFAVCESLTEFTIPSGLEEIDVSAFANCIELREFKVAEGNTHFTVEDGVLFNADKTVLWAYPIGSKLDIYEMPNTVERVEAYAFSEAAYIKEIKFSENLKHIDDEAFHNCLGLTSITLPDGFESTGGGAFQGCENLSGINLPDTMKRIGPLTFDQTAYYNNLSNWESEMVLYLGNYLLQARGEYDEIAGESGFELGGEYTVKEGTTLIADEAFFLLWNVSAVHLPSTLKYIGDGAFCSCKGLRDVVIPEGVTHIGDTAFWLNPDLQSVSLPSGLQYIGSMAFDDSAFLASIANEESPLGYVNGYIIGSHSSLINADLPDDTVLIAENAFEAAGSSLQSVKLPEGLRIIGDEAFINNRNLKNVTVPATVEFIGDYAFGYTKHYASDAEGYAYNKVNEFVLSGYTNSSADKHAKKYNITFDYLDGCDHEYASSVTTPNTCYAAGVRTYTCKYCDDFYTESIPAGHTNIVIDPAVEPGCNTNGMTEGSHCEACGEVIISQTATPSLNHIIVAEMHEGATCGQGGYTMGVYCKTCEKYLVEPEYIPPTGDHRECAMDEIAATCISEGRTGGTFCQWCGQTVVEPTAIPKNNNHKNVVYDFGYPPTCTTDGAGDGSHCDDCGTVIIAQQVIPTSGHTYDYRYTIDKPATESKAGYKSRHCTVGCDASTDYVELPPFSSVTMEQTTDGIQLSWQPYPRMYAYYYIYRIEVGTDTSTPATASGMQYVTTTIETAYLDTNVKPGMTYQYLFEVKDGHSQINATAETANITYNGTCVHTYDNACDSTCNICGVTRTTNHTYKTTTTKATTSKNGSIVKKCTVCGKVASTTNIKYAKTFTLSATSYTYDGKVKTPSVTVKDSAGKTISASHYTVTYASGRKNAGTYNVKVTMKGNYSGSKTLSFKINPVKISSYKLSATTYTYDGKVKTPSVTVKNANGTALTKDTHYTVTYASGRKNAGTYTVTITGKGNYTGTQTLTFKINPVKISSYKLSATTYTYDGKVKTPSVTVKNANGTTLTKDIHYTVTYASGRKNAGTYKVTIKGKGNYTGTKTLNFKINPSDISKCTVKLSVTSYAYNGAVKTPSVTVKNASGAKLTKNTHYTVTYASGRKNVGTYKVTIKGKGNYTGTKTLTFKIVPRAASINKLTANTKALTIKLNRSLQQSTGYQIQYATNKNFTGAKTKVLSNYKTSTTTLTGLKAKTTYFVRVRTYKKIGSTTCYSNWSSYKYLKTK